MSHRDAVDFLRPLLVSMVGSRIGKAPMLPSWLGTDATFQPDVLGGLKIYAKVS